MTSLPQSAKSALCRRLRAKRLVAHPPGALNVAKLGAPLRFRSFDPVRFGGSSRLTFKRLRRPTALPMLAAAQGLGGYLKRLGARFGWR